VKRYYTCNGCGAKHSFETSQDHIDGLIVAFCPSCGKMKEFLMVYPSEEAMLRKKFPVSPEKPKS